MTKHFAIVLAAVLALASFVPAGAQSREDSLAVAEEIVEITGEVDIVMSVFDDLMPLISGNIRVQYPDISSRQLVLIQDIYREEWYGARDQFAAELSRVYADHLSHDELVALRDFYRSPMGMRIVEKIPLIQESAGEAGGVVGSRVDAAAMPRIEAVIRDEN